VLVTYKESWKYRSYQRG